MFAKLAKSNRKHAKRYRLENRTSFFKNMAKIYDKSVRELMREMIPALGIENDQTFTRVQVRYWFQEKYPKIKDGTIAAHLLRFSVNAPSRVHYSAKPGEDDVFFQLDSSRFRLYSPESDPTPLYEKNNVISPETGAEEVEVKFECKI